MANVGPFVFVILSYLFFILGSVTRVCDTNGDWGQLAENCSLDISSLQKAVRHIQRKY